MREGQMFCVGICEESYINPFCEVRPTPQKYLSLLEGLNGVMAFTAIG